MSIKATVCGVPTSLGKPIAYGGGHIAPTARRLR